MKSKAEEWFTLNKLQLNKSKTKTILFSANPRISQGSQVELLRLTLDDSLTWIYHMDKLCGRLSSVLFLLRNLKKVLTLDILKSAYFSFFHSLISYALVLWGNSPHSNRAFILQKKAIRIMTGAGPIDHCQPLFIELGIMPLPALFIYLTLLEIHGNARNNLTHSDVHDHDTRGRNLIRTQRFRLTKSQRNSLNINIYNILPAAVKDLNSRRFKQKIKYFMLKHCFYSIKDFSLLCSTI